MRFRVFCRLASCTKIPFFLRLDAVQVFEPFCIHLMNFFGLKTASILGYKMMKCCSAMPKCTNLDFLILADFMFCNLGHTIMLKDYSYWNQKINPANSGLKTCFNIFYRRSEICQAVFYKCLESRGLVELANDMQMLVQHFMEAEVFIAGENRKL